MTPLRAKRIETTQTWDDLVLPQHQHDQITYLVARIRQRRIVGANIGKRLGVTALLSGPPGTGTTPIAALIANELGLELYQVDLTKHASSGDDVRGLAALFEVAETGHEILLFDHVDSLFATDANRESNELLHRIERFTGVCLLTSNHAAQIDSTFERRLSLHVRL